ncbi:MAG: glycosyltransferase family 4 protein [Promethearchaeota archaeon]
MNIAGIIPRLDSQGGAEKYLVRLYEILREIYNITIYTMVYNQHIFPEIKENIVELGEPWFLKKLRTHRDSVILNVLGMKILNSKIPRNHDIYNPHIFPANLIKRNPNVYTCQEPPRMLYDLMQETLSKRYGWNKLLFKAYIQPLRVCDRIETNKNVDIIIVNSENSKRYLSKIYRKPLTVVYPGVEDKFFRIKSDPKNKVLVVSRLYHAKRIDLSIRSFAKSENRDMKLEIIGTGPEERNLKILVKKLGLQNVVFRGLLSEKELMKAYSEALMVLYTPIREMFGMVPIEAMASGVPVIATNEGGPKETIINHQTGYLVKANENKIAEKINLLKNHDIRMKMSDQARKRAKQFTWNNVVEKTVRIFKTLL